MLYNVQGLTFYCMHLSQGARKPLRRVQLVCQIVLIETDYKGFFHTAALRAQFSLFPFFSSEGLNFSRRIEIESVNAVHVVYFPWSFTELGITCPGLGAHPLRRVYSSDYSLAPRMCLTIILFYNRGSEFCQLEGLGSTISFIMHTYTVYMA